MKSPKGVKFELPVGLKKISRTKENKYAGQRPKRPDSNKKSLTTSNKTISLKGIWRGM